MATGRFPREVIDEILDRTDIVALIETVLPLKRQGRNMMGLCPFHLEDTPSFSVSPDKQMFYCFGCQKGGNAIDFIMENEHLSFPEALEKLADRAGVTLPKRELTPGQQRVYDEKRRLIEINKAAAAFFRRQLNDTPAALAYLKKRGIDMETAAAFGLGYAGDSWDALRNHLLGKGFKDPDLVTAGVVSKAESGRCFDRFRNRLMFPICDKKGDCIAFGGRVLDDSLPKYMNTQETPVFQKSRNLYGLHLAYTAIRGAGEAYLLEGNIDVVTAHQFGVTNALAPLGTAFTEEHAKILKRYCHRVIVAFDGDGAGQRATDKALDHLIAVGIRPYAMTIPAPDDPDDFLRREGKEGWLKLREGAVNYMDFKIRRATALYDVNSAEGKADILAELIPSLLKIGNAVERSEYIRQIGEELRIGEEMIRTELRRQTSSRRDTVAAPAPLTEKKPRGIALAKTAVLYYAAENAHFFDMVEQATAWNFLETAPQQAVVRAIRGHRADYSWHFRDLIDLAAEEERPLVSAFILDDPFALAADREAMFRDCWQALRKDQLNQQLKEVRYRIKACEKGENEEDINELLQNFQKIQQELRKM